MGPDHDYVGYIKEFGIFPMWNSDLLNNCVMGECYCYLQKDHTGTDFWDWQERAKERS